MATVTTVHVEAVSDDTELADNTFLKAETAALVGVTEGTDLQVVALPEATGPVQVVDISNPHTPGVALLLVVPVTP